MLLEEIVAAWRRKDTTGFMWKVEFAKAYDSIDWCFLWNALLRWGFSETWVHWVKQCVTTSTFAVLLNGRPQGGWIHPQRGIRQGCPLAPLLFILAVDALTVCTLQVCLRGALTGFQLASLPDGISLLQYANDTTFFIQGSMAATQTLSIMMDIFSDFSGLRLNRAKSIFVEFGLSEEEMSGYSQILATPIRVLPIRYLGVPLLDHRLWIQDWQPIFEKVETRLGGWRACLLSRGGRLILLKAVLAAIPIYYMSIFTMSAGERRRLEKIMQRFLWRGSQPDEARGTALVAWSTVCRPVTQGGLGIRHLQHTNMTFLTKWVRRMMQPSNNLVTVVLRDGYGSSLDWEMWRTPRHDDSAFMSSVRTCFPQVQRFFQAQLGDGETFWFWVDNWSGHDRLDRLFPRL